MSEAKLRTAVLGLAEAGRLLLKAAAETGHFQIQAVADRDTKVAERLAGQHECAAYDDYRQLVIQNELDCLLVAAPMHSCDEHVRAAMKKKCNVLKLAPAARNFDEAAAIVRLAEEQAVKFAIANPYRFAGAFIALREFLQEGRIEQAFLVTAFCNLGDQSSASWHTDPKLAGGGVLLRNCYGIIDQIVWNFAVPQQLYALNTSRAQDKQQRLYLTEDTAVVTMKFSDTFVGNIVAFRQPREGPDQELLKIYGKDKVLTVSTTQLSLADSLGKIREKRRYDDNPLGRMAQVLENFALSIKQPDKNRLYSSGRENLKNMAVIEAAYLSARTAFPEEPATILQMASGAADTATST
jgi:predicted dehydrogenase